jgi:cytochrome bd-type quinol oxidase subunit 1
VAWVRTGDEVWRLLARRWARALGVLFAVGAVSGTILSFELGILWLGLIGTYGEVMGLPFAIEGIWFFTEAIFLGVYLYAWDRLPPKAHMLTAVPIVIAGVAGAFSVVAANAWMNQPRGFDLVNGRVTNVDPWAAMFNPATWPQTTHMILAAYLVTGFGVASVYAVALLRGRRDRYPMGTEPGREVTWGELHVGPARSSRTPGSRRSPAPPSAGGHADRLPSSGISRSWPGASSIVWSWTRIWIGWGTPGRE